MGHAGDCVRPLLFVPGLLRRAAGGVRLVARRHRGGVLDLVDRAGDARARGGDPGGPRGATPGHARRGVPTQRRVRLVEPDRITLVALRGDGSAGRVRVVRRELGTERGADLALVHRAAGPHSWPCPLRHWGGAAGARPPATVVNHRSEERRVGKERRSRWAPYYLK